MSSIDLSGDVTTAIDEAGPSGSPLVLGHVDDDGWPIVSFRGGLFVLDAERIGLWVRNPEGSFASSVAARPQVTLMYYAPAKPTGITWVSARGRARRDPSADDAVYAGISAQEREADSGRGGGAFVIELDYVETYDADENFVVQVRE